MLKVPCQRYSENDAKMRNFITLHLLGLFCCKKVLELEKKGNGGRTRQQKQAKKGGKVVRMLGAQVWESLFWGCLVVAVAGGLSRL